MSALVLKAHAKINLYLEVGQELPSGYHEITSVMQSLDLADEIIITEADGLVFQCDNPVLENGDNLVMAAATWLRRRFKPNGTASLHLSKKIPVAAGMGGGSADAAATLIGLNRFWTLGLDVDELRKIGAEIGADVPFCIGGGTALVGGIGETVTPLPPLDLGRVILAKPEEGLAAKDVYHEYDRLRVKAARSVEQMKQAIAHNDRRAIIDAMANDLEPAAISLQPKLSKIKQSALAAGATAAMVSGSGTSVIIFPGREKNLEGLTQALVGQAAVWTTFFSGCGVQFVDPAYADSRMSQ